MAKKESDKGTWKKDDVEVVKHVVDGKVVKDNAKKEKKTKPEDKKK